MKHKHLVWRLEALASFEEPKLHLEQYSTSPEMAAEIVEAISVEEGLDGKVVGDFGCGPGILMIAAALMGAEKCVGYEIDADTTELCRRNIEEAEVEEICSVEVQDVLSDSETSSDQPLFDLILINPPFGTKNNEGTDLRFVQAALHRLKDGGSVYSLHKTSTRDGIVRNARTWSTTETPKVVAELRWELPKTYRHQRKQTVDIAVDLIRYRKSAPTTS